MRSLERGGLRRAPGPSTSPEVYEGSSVEWDAAVARLDGGTFCHLWGWGEVFRKAFRHETHRWIIRDAEGRISGLLPLVRLRSRLFGNNLVSMPFLNYGGPVGSAESRMELARHAVRFGQETRADLVELRGRQTVEAGIPVSTSKVTVLLSLPADPQELWKEGLKAKVRSQIRRPMKAGMMPRFGPGLLDDFYRVFARNMRDLGTPVLPRRFFREIASVFEDHLLVCVVYAGEDPVAAGCGFLYGSEFELTWASALREHSREAPNMLLYWSLMEEVVGRGGTVFNFGRCTPGGGTHRFKLQWGGKDEQLHWARWSPSGEGTPPSADRGVFRTAVAVWQRLPLPVANALGPRISRGLPSW